MEPSDPIKKDNLYKDYGSPFGLEDGEIIGISKILTEFNSLNYKELIPPKKFSIQVF